MKIILLKNKLVEALNLVERATGSNPSLPILKSVLIEARENKISMSATNLEFAVTYSFSGKIVEAGSVAVPAPLLAGLVKNLSSERVTLELKGKKLSVVTENYEAGMQTQEVKDFPIIPRLTSEAARLETTTRGFGEGLMSVISATQLSEIRPEISGVFVTREGGVMLVATDSFRLAEKHFDSFKSESLEGVRAVVPIRTAEEVLRILTSREDTPLDVFFDDTQVFMKTNDIEVVSRLVDGNFPDYKAIVPKEVKTDVIVDRQEFLQALRLVSTFSTKINDVRITVGEGGKHIEVSSSNSSLGENVYKIPAKIKGDSFSVAFNWRFLVDALKSFSEDDVSFGVNGSGRPSVIRGAGDKSLLYVVMPLTI